VAGADINRISFAMKEYRTTAPIEDTQVLARHPLAVELDYLTMFRDEADATAFGGQVLALRKFDRWSWACLITRGNYPTLEVGQTITLFYPRYGFNSGADFIIKKRRRDAGLLFDELVLFGPKGLAFDQHIFALDFVNQEYWKAGAVTGTISSLSGYLFTRTNEQGARDRDGGVDYFAANIPAINGLGYHPYSALTNSLLYSQAIGTSPWNTYTSGPSITITADQAVAPDGTTTADKIVMGATSVGQHCFFAQSPGTLTAVPYTYSIWLRGEVGGEKVYVLDQENAGTVVNTGVFVTLTTEWQRFTKVITGSTFAWWFGVGNHSNIAGQQASSAQTIYAWQGQLLNGNYPDGGPVIRTTSAAITLSTSTMHMDVKAAAANLTEDFYVEGLIQNSGNLTDRRFAHLISTALSTQQFYVQILNTTNQIRVIGASGGQAIGYLPGITINSMDKFSFIYSYVQATKTLQFGVRCNGMTVLSAPTANIQTDVTGLNRMRVDVAIGNVIIKFLGVKAGTLTDQQMSDRLYALLGG
jgi:hypothetical protein